MEKRSKITALKGVGEKTGELFHKVGVDTLEELIEYYPRAYDIYKEPVEIDQLEENITAAVKGSIVSSVEIVKVRSLQIISVQVRDETGKLKIVWYNMPFLKKSLRKGCTYIFRGRIGRKNGSLVLEQPEIFTLGKYEEQLDTMMPVYPLTAGLTNRIVSKAVRQGLENLDLSGDFIPAAVREKYHLSEYNFAVWQIHFPKDQEFFAKARRRIVFGEFFLFILALRTLKENKERLENHFFIKETEEVEKLISSLPYTLTGAQKKVWEEIKRDMMGESVMSRLIQGDVGSGKTVIAVIALLAAAKNGFQGALMVPTEVLARQHYESIVKMFETAGISCSVALLTGSVTAASKRKIYEKIASHEVDIVVGTHALIQEKVVYDKLALVITDEQHRFGVRQREALSEKGSSPHILVMSATPIPRTLAIIMYGDLDISVIDELPANRLPIKNCVVDVSYRKTAYHFIEKEVLKGHQVYIICPMVEESEAIEAENVLEYTERLRAIMPPSIVVEYLHGKMKPKEKNDIMERFAANRIQILVSTTVVEVGVNVSNATVMMIENAERFGLAQLHQLRGRVGRGNKQSYCILMSGSKTKETKERLEILNKSNDGFFIASEDLKLRGPGDFFGVRQSGMMEFKMGDVYTDVSLLQSANEAASDLMKEDESLAKEENAELKKKLKNYIEIGLDKLNL